MVRLSSLLGGLVSLVVSHVSASPVPPPPSASLLPAEDLNSPVPAELTWPLPPELVSPVSADAEPEPEPSSPVSEQVHDPADPAALEARAASTLGRSNDWSCKSTTHPNPVILLHGLFASEKLDLNFVEVWLRKKGFCTFALLYGSYTPNLPILGGLKPVAESSYEVAAFIQEVHNRTGAEKVDLVGHSESGFQAMYVPKFHGLGPIVDQIVAIAPPTHGTDISGLWNLLNKIGGKFGKDFLRKLLDKFGCGACNDFAVDGPGVRRLNDGKPIAQPGNTLTVIASRYDEIVTPAETAFVHEPGVNNIWVQDYCPVDPVGHLGVSVDLNVWRLVLNSLERSIGRKFFCLLGPPGRR